MYIVQARPSPTQGCGAAYQQAVRAGEKIRQVEQRDLRTEKFDEHKALVGYDRLTDAMSAYDRAFSDGRGFERIKDIQEMSVDEFKAWVKSDKPKKAKREHERIDQEILAREDTTTQPDMMMAALQRASGPDAKPIHVTTMGDETSGGHVNGFLELCELL